MDNRVYLLHAAAFPGASPGKAAVKFCEKCGLIVYLLLMNIGQFDINIKIL
jgi:hypothetical protein